MTPEATVELSDSSAAICLSVILLVPLFIAGLCLISTGLSRSRSAAHTMLTCICISATAMLIYFVCGFAWQQFANGPAYFVNVGGKTWNWLGAGPFFLRAVHFDDSRSTLTLLLGFFSVALASTIPAASAAERWRLRASCASTALLAGWIYPLFAHWVCGGGWLTEFGFVDPGGASFIHVLGGVTALSITWLLGPRRGKFTTDGIPTAMPGHNAVVVLFGCMLALIGCISLNSAGALLFADVQLARLPLVALNTSMAAAAAAVTAALMTKMRFGKPDASLTANGWTTGLVASSAACAFVKPAEAVVIGFIAGALVIFAIETIELRMRVDDPAGAIAMHAVGGTWGVLAAGIFGEFSNNRSGQLLPQLVGIATLIGFVLPLTYSLNWLLDRFLPQRVSSEAERQGVDLFELGAGAYPDFLTHREDLRH